MVSNPPTSESIRWDPRSILKQMRFPLDIFCPWSILPRGPSAPLGGSGASASRPRWACARICRLALCSSLLRHALMSFASWWFHLYFPSPAKWAINFLIPFKERVFKDSKKYSSTYVFPTTKIRNAGWLWLLSMSGQESRSFFSTFIFLPWPSQHKACMLSL